MSWLVMKIMEPALFFSIGELWVKSTLLLALAWVVTHIAKRASASFRYTVWVTAIFGLITLPFLVQLVPKFQPLKLARAEQATFDIILPSEEVAPTSPRVNRVPEINEPIVESSTIRETRPPNQVDMRGPLEPVTPRATSFFNLTSLILGLWFSGMIVVTLWLARSYRMVHRLIELSKPIDHAGALDITKSTAAHYGLKSVIVLRESSHTDTPLVCGLWQPFVLLPLTWRDWPIEKLQLVLLHEFAHIVRRDVPIRALAYALLPIYWMNPFIWTTIQQLSWEQERACDDLVLGSGAKPSAYAKVLMAFADLGTSPRLITATQISDTTIKNRILSVLNSGMKRAPLKRLGVFVIMLVASTLLGLTASATLVATKAKALAADVSEGTEGLLSLAMGAEQPILFHQEDLALTTENSRELSVEEFFEAATQLQYGSPEEANAAANRLRDTTRPEAIEFLRVAIADYRQVTTLENGEKVRDYLTPGRTAAKSLAAMNQFDLLHQALKSVNPVVRGQAAYGLRFTNNSDSIQALGLLLNDEVTSVRVTAIWALSHIHSPDTVKLLAPLTIDEDLTVCERAITGIQHIHDRTSAGALADALSDPRKEVRFEAVKALAGLPGEVVVSRLGQALADPEPDIRVLAAKTLRHEGDVSNIPALLHALDDRDTRVRHHSVLALWKIRYEDGEIGDGQVTRALRKLRSDPFQAVRLAAKAALAQIGVSDSNLALRRKLLDPNPQVRLKTAFALAKIGDKSGRDELIAALKDPGGKHRARAASALGKIPDQATMSALSQVLNENKPSLQTKAIRSLGHIRDPAVIPDLIPLLKNPDGRVRVEVIRALGSFRDLTIAPKLRLMLRDSHAKVRAKAVVALKDMRDLASIATFRKMLFDPNSHVRANAADALGIFKDEESVPALISLCSDSKAVVRSHAVSALGDIDSSMAFTTLIKALKDPDMITRKNAAMALANDPAAKDDLIKAQKDRKKEVRIAALHSLSSLKDDVSLEQLATSLNDPEESVRRHAVIVIGLDKTELARQILVKALDDESEPIQFEAAAILSQSGETRALPILNKMLNHESISVRDRGERSIKNFKKVAHAPN